MEVLAVLGFLGFLVWVKQRYYNCCDHQYENIALAEDYPSWITRCCYCGKEGRMPMCSGEIHGWRVLKERKESRS